MTRRAKKLGRATCLTAPMTTARSSAGAARLLPLLELLVGLLDDDDRGVVQGADGDGQAAEGHDVGRDPQQPEGDEGQQDRDRDGDDRDERAGDVPEEEEDHEADGEQDLEERRLQVADGPVDEVGPVIDRDDLDPGGQARPRPRSILALTRSMTSRAFWPCRMTTMPETTSPWPSSSATPRRMSGPRATFPRSLIRIGVPLGLAETTMSSKSFDGLRVAPAADHVFGPAELDQAPADLGVAPAHGLASPG